MHHRRPVVDRQVACGHEAVVGTCSNRMRKRVGGAARKAWRFPFLVRLTMVLLAAAHANAIRDRAHQPSARRAGDFIIQYHCVGARPAAANRETLVRREREKRLRRLRYVAASVAYSTVPEASPGLLVAVGEGADRRLLVLLGAVVQIAESLMSLR